MEENSKRNHNIKTARVVTYRVGSLRMCATRIFQEKVAMSGRREMEENSNENQKLQQITCTYRCFIVLQHAVVDVDRR